MNTIIKREQMFYRIIIKMHVVKQMWVRT